MNRVISNSEAETFSIGSKFASVLKPGMCVLLSGELGAGKTAFVRGVCCALGINEKVVRSPSFTLINEYSGKIPVAHVDLYRLEGNKDSAASLLLHEFTDDGFILMVEWAQNGNFDMFDDALKISVNIEHDGMTRRIFTFLSHLPHSSKTDGAAALDKFYGMIS